MNQTYTPKFQEEYSAKIPALTLLTSLGWTFLSPKQIMDYRGYKQDEVVLRPVLREELSKRSFMAGGKTCQLSEKALDNLISQVCSPALNEGLLKANERMYNHLLYGIAVTEFVDGKKVNPTIALIDWEHPENNQFHFTEEFTVLRSGGVETRRPDIVCFVNGIPLAVIEAKSPAGHGKKGPTIDEGISQSIRNQLNDEFKAGKNQNQLSEENIKKIVKTYRDGDNVEKYAYLASLKEIQDNDYNLNIPRYVDTFEEEEEIDLLAVRAEREQLKAELAKLETEMAGYLKELGYDS
ncbi:type I restriction endonuclease [Klebsiella pneumoniae]|uniref:type I restriction endonuclease n=1 Tax=Klebsiella pneumoniae TaxID=573 RepID=UPI0039677ACB